MGSSGLFIFVWLTEKWEIRKVGCVSLEVAIEWRQIEATRWNRVPFVPRLAGWTAQFEWRSSALFLFHFHGMQHKKLHTASRSRAVELLWRRLYMKRVSPLLAKTDNCREDGCQLHVQVRTAHLIWFILTKSTVSNLFWTASCLLPVHVA